MRMPLSRAIVFATLRPLRFEYFFDLPVFERDVFLYLEEFPLLFDFLYRDADPDFFLFLDLDLPEDWEVLALLFFCAAYVSVASNAAMDITAQNNRYISLRNFITFFKDITISCTSAREAPGAHI